MSSQLSIPPAVWGPFFWHTVHLAALGYGVNPTIPEKRAAKEFYESLAYMIPCPICKTHYSEFLKKYPITPSLDNRKNLFSWTVQIHNAVNESLNKRQYTEAEAIQFYAKIGARGVSPVVTEDNFDADIYKNMLKGAVITAGAIGLTAGAFWYFS